MKENKNKKPAQEQKKPMSPATQPNKNVGSPATKKPEGPGKRK